MIWDKDLGYVPVYLEYLVPQYLVKFDNFLTGKVIYYEKDKLFHFFSFTYIVLTICMYIKTK